MRPGASPAPAVAAVVAVGLWLLVPCTAFLVLGNDRSYAAHAALQSIVFVVAAACVVARARLVLVLSLPFALLVPAETYFIATYGYPSSRHVIALLSESSMREVGEFLSGVAAWLALSCAAVLAAYAVLWRRSAGSLPVPAAARWGLALLLLALPIALEFSRTMPAAPEVVRKYSFANAFPLGVPYRIASHFKHDASGSAAADAIDRFRFGAQTRVQGPVDVVFVVGESARPDHWQLNGYSRPTNPRLAARQGVVWLGDMITPWALTTYSVPVMVTRKPAQGTAFFPEASILGAVREAGFEVHWLANQDGLRELNLHRQQADFRHVFNLAVEREDVDAAHDGVMLPRLREALARPSPRKFLLVHTKGSHWDYHLRYPDSFREFLPDRSDTGGSVKHDPRLRDRLVNAYDNSIRYTDSFLDDVIAALESTGRPSVLLYVSDHGQALYDGECPVFGHFNDTEANFRSAALVWMSDSFVRQRPQALEQLRRHAGKPLSTESTIFHTLADLAGLSIADGRHSLLSEAFEVRERWVNTSLGALPFDSAARSGACRLLRPGGRPGSSAPGSSARLFGMPG